MDRINKINRIKTNQKNSDTQNERSAFRSNLVNPVYPLPPRVGEGRMGAGVY
jgi:hypothetical protein